MAADTDVGGHRAGGKAQYALRSELQPWRLILKRRQFMQGLLAASPIIALRPSNIEFPPNDPIESLRQTTIPIMQGMTNETTAQFIVQIEKATVLRYYVVDPIGLPREISDVARLSQSYSETAVDKIFVDRLQPGTRYELVVTGPHGEPVDRRNFKTLAKDRSHLRFVLGSCTNEGLQWLAKGIYDQMILAQPDFIFLMGDNVYCDKGGGDGTPPSIWERHASTRANLKIFRVKDLIPYLAIWDDHDYGGNGLGRTYKYKNETKVIFESFFGSRAVSGFSTSGFGVSFVIEAFGHRFFLLDGRTYRSQNGESDEQHWGSNQEDWLFAQLQNSDLPTYLMTGTQYFGGYLAKESMEFDQPKRLEVLCDQIKRAHSPVVLCSGDVHFSEIMSLERELLGYPTFELTASSVHSYTWPFGKKQNDRRLDSTWKHNFMLVDSHISGSGVNIHVRCLSDKGRLLFQRELLVNR